MTEDNGDGGSKASRRKLLAGMAVLGTGAAVGGSTTWAFLSDEEEFETTFETGSLALSVDSETLEFNDMDENETAEATVTVCNSGTLDIKNVILRGVELTNGKPDVAKALEVKRIEFGAGQMAASDVATDNNGNGIVDLHDLAKTLSEVSLTSNTGGETLIDNNDNDGKKGECKMLKVVAQIDYSNLAEGMNKESVSATINLRAEQEPV